MTTGTDHIQTDSIREDPIHAMLENWHLHLRGEYPGGLNELLHDDVVFYSPVVFTPQIGKEITMVYLNAAGGVFGGDKLENGEAAPAESSSGDADMTNLKKEGSSFHYTKVVASGHTAMLEFETKMDGKYVNGADIITCNDEGRIVEFKVMIRPLQAVNAVHQNMMEMLGRMKD